MNTIIKLENKDEIIKKVCEYVNIKKPNFVSDTIEENIKEIMVKKLCDGVGIRCGYNYKSDFFEFFSKIAGEAVCEKLNLPFRIAGDEFRLVRYEKLNLIESVKEIFEEGVNEESTLDAFHFIDRFKYLIKVLKR